MLGNWSFVFIFLLDEEVTFIIFYLCFATWHSMFRSQMGSAPTSYIQSIIALAWLSKGMQFIEDRFVKFNVCIERSVASMQNGYYCIKMRIPWMSIQPKAKFDMLTWLHIRVNSRKEKKEDCKERQGRSLCAFMNRHKNQRLALGATNTYRHDFPLKPSDLSSVNKVYYTYASLQ